jgi:putative oxidoreductase
MNSDKKYDVSLLIIRLTLGFIMLAHGVQKLFGWFGGYGFDGTVGFFTGTIGLPYILAVLIILTESIGMILLLAGLFSRYLAFATVIILLGAVSFHWHNGFYMNWSGALGGEGFEFHIVVIALALIIAINGGGVYSLDRLIFSRNDISEKAFA